MTTKELFNKLEKEFDKSSISDKFKERQHGSKLIIYENIINICLVHMGVRSGCLIFADKELLDVLKSVKDFDDNMKMIYHKMEFNGKPSYEVFFINLKVIKKYKLEDDYNLLKEDNKDKFISHEVIGRILGYLCPVDIFTKYEEYIVIGKQKKRYTYSYDLYMKKDNKLLLPKGQLFAFICYDKDTTKKRYIKALDYLQLLRKSVNKIVDNMHVGMEYAEEFI